MHVEVIVLGLLLTVDLSVAKFEVLRNQCMRTGMFQVSEKGKDTSSLLLCIWNQLRYDFEKDRKSNDAVVLAKKVNVSLAELFIR